MAVEFWTMGSSRPSAADSKFLNSAGQAMRAEEMGYDGLVFGDSQNMSADCYISLAQAAQATSTIKLGTGVTNTFTRHAAVHCISDRDCASRERWPRPPGHRQRRFRAVGPGQGAGSSPGIRGLPQTGPKLPAR